MLGYTIDELKQTRVYQEAKAEGKQSGREEEATSLILRQLTRRLRLHSFPESLRNQVERLSLPQLENLSEALLDFQTLADLELWLGDSPA